MIDYDRLNLVAEKRWHLRPQGGVWLVFQDHEVGGCSVIIARHEDLRTAIDIAGDHGDENMQAALKMITGAGKPSFTTEFTMNPGEEPAVTPDPLVAFLQLTAASHPGLNDEARRLIHQAAEVQRTRL